MLELIARDPQAFILKQGWRWRGLAAGRMTKGGKLDAKESRTDDSWAELSRSFGMRSHRERATLQAEAERVAEEARELAGEVPF